MLTLFHAPRSRSSRFIWLLEETGAPYEITFVSIERGDGSGKADPSNPHPDKKVPALVHDGALITESSAICVYLSDLFPQSSLGPPIGHPLRGPYLTWLAYYAGVMEPVIQAKVLGAPDRDGKNEKAYRQVCQRIQTALELGPYLLGQRFSTADALLASALQFSRTVMPDAAVFDEHMRRCLSRPAFSRAMAKDSP